MTKSTTTTGRRARRKADAAAVPAESARRPPKPRKPSETTQAAQDFAAPKRAATKLDVLVELLSKPGGATIAAMTKATDWQAHSVRGAIAGAIRKQRGLKVASHATDGGGRVYRIVSEAAA